MFTSQNTITPLSGKSVLLSLFIVFFSSTLYADTLLMWSVEERAGSRDLASASHPLVTELRSQMSESLSLLTPLMDLIDQQAVDATTLWRGDQEIILDASSRYSPDHILVARIDEDGFEPLTEWLIWLSGERLALSTQGDWSKQAGELLAFVLDHAVQQPDITPEPLTLSPTLIVPGFSLTLYQLHQPADFLEATDALRKMFGQSAIRVVSFNAGILRVSIQYEGAQSGLQRELQSHPRFNEMPDGQLEFSWN